MIRNHLKVDDLANAGCVASLNNASNRSAVRDVNCLRFIIDCAFGEHSSHTASTEYLVLAASTADRFLSTPETTDPLDEFMPAEDKIDSKHT